MVVLARLFMPKEAFDHINTWIFDLDNTLYDAHGGIWQQISARMTVYVAQLFGLDGLSARALQHYYYQTYGTTLNGLMKIDGHNANEFMDFVHDIDHSSLNFCAHLHEGIANLKGRIFIMTNGDKKHANAVLKRLQLEPFIEGIFDVSDAQYQPKPKREAYQMMIEKYGIDPTESAMFEDIPKNLVVPHELGMTTVLITSHLDREHRHAWEDEGNDGHYIDFTTSSLSHFLENISRKSLTN